MSRISDLLARKPPQVHSVHPDDTVKHAIERMIEHNVGAVLVLEGERVRGIFTERDVLRRVVLAGRVADGTHVREVMTERLVFLAPDRSVEECMAVMTNARVRHLPIVDGSALAGIISIGDVVRHLNAEHEVELRYLSDYITGRYPG
jgi:CBS domain-containing protein